MNLYLSTIIEFPWFGGWDMESWLHVDLHHWVWFKWYKEGGELADIVLGKELGLTGRYLNWSVQILCFGFSLEGTRA